MSVLNQAIKEFVGAFEVVFRHDWKYTQLSIPHINEGSTLIDPAPTTAEYCQFDNWWAGAILLEKYRKLLAVMKERNMEPLFSVELVRVMTVFKDTSPTP